MGAYSQVYPIETKVVLPWPDCNGIQECNHWAMRYDDKDGNKWRYIVYNNGEEELYNQINDPYEQTNIAKVDATTTATLKQKLIDDIGKDKNPWSKKCMPAFSECSQCPECAWKAFNP